MNYLKACCVQIVQLCKKPGIKDYFKATLMTVILHAIMKNAVIGDLEY